VLSVLDEELPKFGVVGQRARAGELKPCGASPLEPGFADWFGLLGFDRPGGETELALGDLGPDEGGRFLSFAVVQGGLDGAWDGRQVFGDFVPGAGTQAPSLQSLTALAVVDEVGGGVQALCEALQRGCEAG
jgi:hypothetical protein